MAEVNIPNGFGIPLVNLASRLLPAPTMDALDDRYASVELVAEVQDVEAIASGTAETVNQGRLSESALTSQLAPALPRSLAMSGPKRVGRAPVAVIEPTPLFMKSQSALNNLYWPQIIDLRSMGVTVDGDPVDWAMVYSSDHQGGAGAGCAIAFAPAGASPLLASSWTEHSVIVNVASGGSNPETPRLFYDDNTDQWLLFFSTSAAYTTGQHTRIFSASNIEGPYTDTGKHIALAANDVGRYPADGDTTYFNPFRLGDIWVAYSILGGTDYGFNAIWHSNNGLDWFMDPRPLAWESHLFPDAATTLGSIGVGANTVAISYGGVLYGITASSTPASGATQSPSRRWLGRLRPDLRGWDGSPSEITYSAQPWMNGGSYTPLSSFEYNGELWTPFTALGSMAFGLARLVF